MRRATAHAAAMRLQRGFTLVELMVGLVLGLLTVLVITQVLALAEGKKRTVSMGSDAQVNGALALYTLQREIQTAGYGVASNQAALGCLVKGKYTNPDASASPATADVNFTLAPVMIQDGASGAPDTITVLQGQTARFSAPVRLTEVHDKNAQYFKVQSTLGIAPGDLMIAVPQTPSASDWCTLFAVTNDGGSATTTLSKDLVPHTAAGNPAWNHQDVFPSAAYDGVNIKDSGAPRSYLLNVGGLTQRAYSISSAQGLQVVATTSNAVGSAATELFPQIVNLQALYGKDTNNDEVIDRWDGTTPTTAADWMTIKALRVAVVARSNQWEREPVTTTGNGPRWDLGASDTIVGVSTAACPAPASGNQCAALKVDHLNEWQHYRYKVYDAVIPLRNMLWAQ